MNAPGRAAAGFASVALLLALAFALLACSSGPAASGAPLLALPATEPPAAALIAPAPEPTPEPAPALAAGPLSGRRICLDPGHDARWVPGASGHTSAGAIPRTPSTASPWSSTS